MKKLLILSGKGGTGKTTTAASFLRFSKAAAIADCDVDAPNLHIVADMKTEPETKDFFGSEKATINQERCIQCGACIDHCRFAAIRYIDGQYRISEYACEGCGVCEAVCLSHAISLEPDVAGKLSLYRETPLFSTATLKMGRGNSGLLVTEVKNALSEAPEDAELAIIDGSPGIGCPVIASVTGTDLVLIVAEPSRSGLSDLRRILTTTSILNVKAAVCVNKYDTSLENTEEIIHFCEQEKIPFMGKIPYDKHASEAVNKGISLADYDCPARDALYEVYENTMKLLK